MNGKRVLSHYGRTQINGVCEQNAKDRIHGYNYISNKGLEDA
jgi:hypothetical protein